MNEMVERVAQAIALWDGTEWGGFLGSRECSRNRYRDMARAAIEAMRDPTLEMQAAVAFDHDIQCGLDDCNKHDIPDKAWRIMIDAALK